MKLILDQLGLRNLAGDTAELLELIEGEIDGAINKGDFLGMGEWLACKLDLAPDDDLEAIFTMIIRWMGISSGVQICANFRRRAYL